MHCNTFEKEFLETTEELKKAKKEDRLPQQALLERMNKIDQVYRAYHLPSDDNTPRFKILKARQAFLDSLDEGLKEIESACPKIVTSWREDCSPFINAMKFAQKVFQSFPEKIPGMTRTLADENEKRMQDYQKVFSPYFLDNALKKAANYLSGGHEPLTLIYMGPLLIIKGCVSALKSSNNPGTTEAINCLGNLWALRKNLDEVFSKSKLEDSEVTKSTPNILAGKLITPLLGFSFYYSMIKIIEIKTIAQ